jgi:hypothetical protein
MDALLVVNVEIPKHVAIWCVRAGVSLVASVQRREFDWVSDEEDRLFRE